MKYFDWDIVKNKELELERDITFEEVLDAIDQDKILDTIEHPNKKKYPNQKVYIIEIDNYAYRVPFVEDDEKFFLKTIIPSRKDTKKYIIDKQK